MSSEASISPVDIEQAAKRFVSAWQRGEQPAISDYCPPIGSGSRTLLQELVVIDLECRLKAGQHRSAEDYLREFPQLQADEQAILRLLRVEARWNVRGGSGPLPKGNDADTLTRNDPAELSGSALETMSGADLSVVAATRSPPQDLNPGHGFSGATLSGTDSPSTARLLTVGSLGRFRLVDAVGQGAFGTVFRAIDTELGRVVAVKVPKEGVLGSEKDQERFIREARSAAALRHAHIVPVYEVGGTREQPFIVSAFVSGCPLSKALACRKFAPREAAAIVRQLADALHYAHERGVVHRDVKPSNIMLDDLGEPYLMDFGLARREGEALITVAGAILGTPAYMSPEQAEGTRVDARTDVYSLGVVLYELLTGERPFRGNVQSVLHQVLSAEPRSPLAANRAIPLDLATICLKCMQKAAGDRYPSARALEEDLSRFLAGRPVRARPISPVARAGRWARHHPTTAISLLVALVLGIILPVVWLSSSSRVERAAQELANANQDSRRQKELATEADLNARRLTEASHARLRKLFVSRGNEKIESGDAAQALPWFAAALEQLPAGSPLTTVSRSRLVTALEALRLTRMWQFPGPINGVARCPNRPLLALALAARTAAVLDLSDPADGVRPLPYAPARDLCVFSHDGQRLATNCNDGSIHVRLTSDLSKAPLVLSLVLAEDDRQTSMCFDPTDRLLAVATRSGAVQLWNVADGTRLSPALVHHARVNHLAFNGDGSVLATASSDGRVHLWSVKTRTEISPPLAHRGAVTCVAFTPGGSLVSGSEDGTVRVWDAKSHAQQCEFHVGDPVVELALSPDGKLVAAGCRNGRVEVWNLTTRQVLPGDFRHQGKVRSLAFSKQDDLLVTGGDDRTARIWDLKNGTAARPPAISPEIVVWADLSDDRHLLTAGLDGIVREWSVGTAIQREIRCPDNGAPTTVQLSPDGRWLLLAGTRGPAQLCDLNAGTAIALPLANSTGTPHAAFAPDAAQLALAENNGDLALWDVRQQPKRVRVHKGNLSPNGVDFSPDGQSLVIAGADGTARVFSAASGVNRLSLAHGAGLKRALYSRDGRLIYTVGGPRTLRLWDSESGRMVAEFRPSLLSNENERDEIDDCHLTPDGRFLLIVRHSTKPVVCDAATGAPVSRFLPHPISLGFTDDGKRLVATTSDQTAGIWDLSGGRQIASQASHRGETTCCAIRGDGLLFATGGADKTARVWDAQTGESASPPLPQTDRVIFEAFREEGRQLVTVSADAVIRLWALDDGSSTEHLCHLARATSGVEIDGTGTAIALKPAQIDAEWRAAGANAGAASQ